MTQVVPLATRWTPTTLKDAVEGALTAAQGVHVVALADVFQDRLEHCGRQLQKVGMLVSRDRCFTGINAYEKVMALPDVDYVILATPPHFRPAHLRAAVEAGKHTFVEKPAAIDAMGVRSVIESGEIAKKKNRRLEQEPCIAVRMVTARLLVVFRRV